MKKVFLTLLTLNVGICYANTNEYQHNMKHKSDWITDTKKDDNENIIEFQAKYEEQEYGILIIYVIPFNLKKDRPINDNSINDIKCEIDYVRFEFNLKKFNENNININSGKIWINNSDFFTLNNAVNGQYEDNLHLDIKANYFDEYLRHESNLKITFDKTRIAEKSYKDSFSNLKMIWNPLKETYIPFLGARAQLQKAQSECIRYLQSEKIKIAEIKKLKEQDDVKAAAYKKQQSVEVERKNAEIQKRISAQMKKPDVKIGMTRQQVVKNTRWGTPLRVNTTVTKYGTSEQWVYWGYKYLYFENDELIAIQK